MYLIPCVDLAVSASHAFMSWHREGISQSVSLRDYIYIYKFYKIVAYVSDYYLDCCVDSDSVGLPYLSVPPSAASFGAVPFAADAGRGATSILGAQYDPFSVMMSQIIQQMANRQMVCYPSINQSNGMSIVNQWEFM